MIGCPFEAVGGEELHINDFIKGGDAMYFPDGQEENVAELQVQKEGGGYTIYWLEWDGDDEENPNFFWNSLSGEADFTVKPGFSCWFKNTQACTITVAGQVADTSKDSITVDANTYTMIANPFPVAVKLNSDKIDCKALSAMYYPEGQEENVAEIQIQKAGGGYNLYWLEWDGDDEENPNFFWNGLSGEADETIQPMTGFWLLDPQGGTIKFVL